MDLNSFNISGEVTNKNNVGLISFFNFLILGVLLINNQTLLFNLLAAFSVDQTYVMKKFTLHNFQLCPKNPYMFKCMAK